MRCLPLNERTYRSLSDNERSRIPFGFVSSSSIDGENNNVEDVPVGWTMRNLVAYLSLRLGLGERTSFS